MNTRPWMLKNVTDEERNAAIMAADKAGEPIGRWCGRRLHEAAQAVLAPSRKQAARIVEDPVALAVQADAADRLLKLSEAADRLARLPDVRGTKSLRTAGFRLIRNELRTPE
jgi:hypothetical protein